RLHPLHDVLPLLRFRQYLLKHREQLLLCKRAVGPYAAVFTQHRSISATLQACAIHPRGVNGSSAAEISQLVPSPASFSCGTRPLSKLRAPARSSGYTRSLASIKGPMSQAHTVP